MRALTIATIALLSSSMPSQASTPTVTVLYTTDVHGCFFPYDFIKGTPAHGSLARVATLVDSLREGAGHDNVLLLDNGDFLQGQPAAYYYNFIDTANTHVAARIFNYLGYDAVTIGNHDVETGHPVYDRLAKELDMPMLGANVIDTATGKPYFKPYIIKEVQGRKIAIIGLITPAIPAWLPERLWEGMTFADMVSTARHRVEEVKRLHHPDVIIGLFHSGHDSSNATAGYRENESIEIARKVEGFDAVLMGHDHRQYCDTVTGPYGDKVWALNPANNALAAGLLTIAFPDGRKPEIEGSILKLDSIEPSEEYMQLFAEDIDSIRRFVDRPITSVSAPMHSQPALNGPSEMMTLIHELQLHATGAQISLAAPLSLNADIKEGVMTMADMFQLYKYENNLCTMRLTGAELLGYLEESYRQWLSPEGTYPVYNYDSAMGIDYTVDSTQPSGSRVEIISMSDGRPFDPDDTYTVALNSYRARGGGNHLTRGAGLTAEEIDNRIVYTSPKDVRYYLIEYLRTFSIYEPHNVSNWRFK